MHIGRSSVSKDGVHVEIASNIASENDIDGVLENDSDGVGLFRSEFLYMNRSSLPDEETQFRSYKAVVEGLNGKPVIIRTLDVGGDKEVEYLNIPKEMNPFLGYRAIRYCLRNLNVFKTQLRALLRSSAYGNLWIMFPMVATLQEVRKINSIVKETEIELRNEGIKVSDDYKVGIMIEIPSAAVISDVLAKEVDFFSIGTNDLIQYTVAVDRMNENIKELYTPYNPAVLRLIKMVIENGNKAGIPVGMCGSEGGNPLLIPVFLGMGLNKFSMSPSKVLLARKIISSINKADMEKVVDDVMLQTTKEEVLNYLTDKFGKFL